MKRRTFLKKAALGTVAATAATVGIAPTVMAAEKKFKWKMVTTWPPKLPLLQTGADRILFVHGNVRCSVAIVVTRHQLALASPKLLDS